MLTFLQYVEGILAANRGPRPWLSRINATVFTNEKRKRIAGKKGRRPNWFKPTVRQVVPPHWVAKLP
jgi:hypothetical protein